MPNEHGNKVLLEKDQEDKLGNLYEDFANHVRDFIIDARAQGMSVAIFEGFRSFERQQELFNKGRDANGNVVDRKAVVTNAAPGFSFHNYGLAVDIVFDGADLKGPKYQWSWDSKYPWKKLADLGVSHGLDAAYYWHSFPETPHYEMRYGFHESELLAFYNKGGLVEVLFEVEKKRRGKV